MKHVCGLVEQPAQPVLSIRTRTSVENLPQVLGDAYGKIMEYVLELKQEVMGAPFVAYYNMDMQDLDVEIGFPVPQPLPGKAEIQQSQIPGGRHAVCMHVGPYSAVEPAYKALMQFTQDKGLKPTGVAYEFYLNDPAVTPQNELQTRISFPLA